MIIIESTNYKKSKVNTQNAKLGLKKLYVVKIYKIKIKKHIQ